MRIDGANCRPFTGTITAWLVVASALVAPGVSAEPVRIKLVSSLAPAKTIDFLVPREYLSPRNAEDLRKGKQEAQEYLYLVFRYAPDSKGTAVPGSPRELTYGAPEITHLFLRIPFRQVHEDVGQWYLDTFIKDAKRKGIYEEPQKTDNGVRRYRFEGPANEIIYTYKDANTKTVTVRCFMRACTGYKTWKGIVRAEYRYDRSAVEQFREVDALIDHLLIDAYKTTQ